MAVHTNVGRKSKRKGKVGERGAATLLEGVRTWEHLHDVFAMGRWWEVKNLSTGFTKVYDALEEHALHYRESGDGPVPSAIVKQDGKPWLVAFYAQDWKDGRADTNSKPED